MNRLKLAEKFDDLVSEKPASAKEREAENLSGAKVSKKLNSAEGILKAEAMKKAIKKALAKSTSLSEKDLQEKIAAADELMKSAKDLAATSKKSMDTGTKTSTQTATATTTTVATSTDTSEGDVPVVEPETPEEVAQAVEQLDKDLVEKILSETRTLTGYYEYKYYVKECVLFVCWDEKKTGLEEGRKFDDIISKKGDNCFKTTRFCERQMIPCDLSKGKSCKPTFTEFACKESKVQIPCPTK